MVVEHGSKFVESSDALTNFAYPFGPFFFAVIFSLVITRSAMRWYAGTKAHQRRARRTKRDRGQCRSRLQVALLHPPADSRGTCSGSRRRFPTSVTRRSSIATSTDPFPSERPVGAPREWPFQRNGLLISQRRRFSMILRSCPMPPSGATEYPPA